MANLIEADSATTASIFGFCGLVLGVIGTAIGAAFRSRSSMAALVDARIRLLIDGYERRIVELQDEVIRLERKVDVLTEALESARRIVCGTGPGN